MEDVQSVWICYIENYIPIGSLQLFQYIIAKVKNKNPQGSFGIYLLRQTNGFCEFKSNPFVSNLYITPLHVAAMYGNLELCKLIIENINHKNPKSLFGSTPFAIAAANDHFEVCKMMIER